MTGPIFCPETSVRNYRYSVRNVDRDSSVGIATRYGLDGPGIECWWERNFSHQSRPALGPTQPLVQWVLVSFPEGVKRPGRGVNHPPTCSSEVKERVQL